MPDVKNSVALKVGDSGKINIQALHGYALNPALSVLQTKKYLMVSAASVTFKANQEPKTTGTLYKDINNQAYYLPDPALDMLEGENVEANSPAVQFMKDEAGNVSLSLQVFFKRPAQADAASLLIPTIENAALVWEGGQMALPSPSYFSADKKSGYRFLLPVAADKSASLVEAMKNPAVNARLQMTLHLSYQVQKNSAPSNGNDGNNGGNNGGRNGGRNGGVIKPVFGGGPFNLVQPIGVHVLAGLTTPLATTATVATPEPAATVATVAALQPFTLIAQPLVLESAKTLSVEKFKINPDVIKRIGEQGNDTVADPDAETQTKQRNDKIEISVSFTGLADNEKHIYAALEEKKNAGYAFESRWQYTEFGVFAPAGFPNRIYMMPHSLRLRYNADTGLPDISPVLYTTPEGDPKVRLRLGMMPWYDFEKVTQLRDFLTAANSAVFMYPQLITDFAAPATLKITTQFTEGITTLGEVTNVDINFSALLSLDLDVTLEFYKFLTTLLEGATGITGTLTVTLKKQDGNAPTNEGEDGGLAELETIESVAIPFSLRIKEIANPQVEFSAPSGDRLDRPTKVEVRNTGKHDLTFKAALPHALYLDSNAMMPMNVFRAPIKQSLPITLTAGHSMELEIDGTGELTDSVWNSVDMVLCRYDIAIDPKEALRKTYELMPPGGLTWTLNVDVPPFLTTPLPAGMEKIFAVMVEITIKGRPPMMLTMKPSSGHQVYKFSPNLSEVADMEGGVDFLEYSYRTQTILVDRMLDWSAPIAWRGSQITVFPTLPQP